MGYGDANVDHFITLETMRENTPQELEHAKLYLIKQSDDPDEVHEILQMLGLEESEHIAINPRTGVPSQNSRLGKALAVEKARKQKNSRANLKRGS